MIDGAGLMDNPSRYEVFLRATWSARRPIERALESAGVADLYEPWPRRRVSDTLSQDLFDVARTLPPEPTETLPQARSDAETLGVLYVLEGSALGARILGTRAAAIGMTAHFGARHLAHQTLHPRAWSEFIQVLIGTHMTAYDEDLCETAALETFKRYEKAFEPAAQAG